MKSKVFIESAIAESVQFGYMDNETAQFVPIEAISEDELQDVADKLGASPALLLAIQDSFVCLREALYEDLCDIWRRLDRNGVG